MPRTSMLLPFIVGLLFAGINGAEFLAVHLDEFGVDHDGCTE
jgi:ribosomal protein S19